ncbi:MAG: hypothetical protein OHK0013_15080 [Sandaracinaceae bacterium]
MKHRNEDSVGGRARARRAPDVLSSLRPEAGPGPSPVARPSVAPRGSEVARRKRRTRSATAAAPSEGAPAFAAERLASLAAKLAARISTWGWFRTYERWRRGERLSIFQRRWLAFSMRRLRGDLPRISHAEFIATRPWPARGGDQ